MTKRNIAASIRARLLEKARADRVDFNLLLTRYALERFLYRLSISRYSDQFLLKGALLFDLWFDIPHRPTRDADLLGFGAADIPRLESIFRALCAMGADDGIGFQPGTVRAEEIRKDYFDLWILARHTDFDGEILRHAIHATFSRRGTLLPSIVPFGLTDEFARDQRKQVQWKAFQRKNGLTEIPLSEVIASLREFFVPLLQGAEGLHRHWKSGEGWSGAPP
ncbi:nucleotidyl transferase AbiEii/AbiGii toxin family protein [Endothiovibrio diazotrophicus]